jgi:hypothetical protein
MRADVDKRVAGFCGGERQVVDRLVDGGAIETVALPHAQKAAQRRRIHVGDTRGHLDAAEAVTIALIDRVGEDEAPIVRVVDTGGGYAHVGEPVLEIEAPQQVAVGIKVIEIVDVARLDEREPARLRRLDDGLEPAIGERPAADEHDALDAGLVALLDLEDEVDLPVAARNRLGGDLDIEAAEGAVHVDHVLDVPAYRGLRERPPRLEADRGGEVLVLELLVALELQVLDHRRLDHGDDEARALVGDPDVLELAGVVEFLQRPVDRRRIVQRVGLAGRRLEVRAYRFRIDAPVALDDNAVVSRGGTQRHGADKQGTRDSCREAHRAAPERRQESEMHSPSLRRDGSSGSAAET